MKKYLALAAMISGIVFLSNCKTSKKTTTEPVVVKTSYQTDVQNLVTTHCSPCHIPSKGGRIKALDTYDALKANIDDVIRRIELNPTDKGFRPFKHPKLSDSTIAVFRKWRDDGLLN